MNRKIYLGLLTVCILWLIGATCFAEVKLGDKGAEVEEVQKYLIAQNFLTGEADGIFGEETEKALKNFQIKYGLLADGICGDETFKMLKSAANDEISAEKVDKILRRGDTGDLVKELQNILIELGYLAGAADGEFGEATETALKDFQSANDLAADGVCGLETLARLEDSSAKYNPKLGRDPEETSNNLTQPKEPLRLGNQGYEVRQLQEVLIGLGYLTGTADGEFGEATEAALKDFQSAAGLTASGIFDAETFNLMNSPTSFSKGIIPANAGVAEVGEIIKPGMHGEGVKYIQRKLIERGFLDGEADGWCGAATVAAIRDFQYSMNLPADGICGILTYAALESAEYITDDDSEWKKSVESFPKFKQTIYVEATAYSRYDANVGTHTASGKELRRGIIAVDPNVIPLGTRVYIPGYGEAVAEDTGGDIVGNRIDIAFDTYEEAQSFGRQTLQIYIIDD